MRAADAFSRTAAEEKRIIIAENKIASGAIQRVQLVDPTDVGQ
jgi:hypothetical protein